MEEMPHINITPRAVISMLQERDPFYCIDTVEEIREKRESMSMGVGGTGLIDLTGLELYGDGHTETYELSLAVPFISVVKEVTDRFWKAQLSEHDLDPETGERKKSGRPGVDRSAPPIVQAMQAMGIEIEPLQFGRVHKKGPARYMSIEEFAEFNGAELEKCCCGHVASEHDCDSKHDWVEQCRVRDCGCQKFHTHDESTET